VRDRPHRRRAGTEDAMRARFVEQAGERLAAATTVLALGD
jgi:hypothetical protein